MPCAFSPPALAQTNRADRSEWSRLWILGIQQHKTGEFEAALQSFQQVLAIFQNTRLESAILGHKNTSFKSALESAILESIGGIHLALSNFDKATTYYQQSLAIARERKNSIGEGRALGGLGAAYIYLGRYAESIKYNEQYLAITHELKKLQRQGRAFGGLGLDYPQGEGIALDNLALAHQALGNYAKAIEYKEQFLESTRERKDRPGERAAFDSLGDIHQDLGNSASAIKSYERSLAIARQIKDRSSEGIALGKLGGAYVYLGNASKATSYQEQSLAILRETKDRQAEWAILGNLGRIYSVMGNYTKAITYLKQGVAIARSVKNQHGEGFSLHGLGVAFSRSGDMMAAEKTFFDSIAIWETIRQTGIGNNDINKVAIFETQANTYRALQRVLVVQKKTNMALEVAERGRARAFVELLAQRIRSQESGSSYQASAVKPPNFQKIQQIASAQNATLVQYSILSDAFNSQGFQELRQSELYIWVVPPTGDISFRIVDLKPLWQQQNTDLQALVVQSREVMGARGRSEIVVTLSLDRLKQQQERQTQKLKQLHQLLIEPIADLLPKDPNQRVIFVPQNELFLVPFPALLDANNKPLIEQHTILSAPSIQVLALTRQQRDRVASRPAAAGKSLIVGNPTMPKIVTQVGDKPVQLADLPGAKQEAIAIAKLFQTEALTGAKATKTAIAQQMTNARLIHFATHGLLDDFKGLGVPGAIALAPSGNGQLNDGLLTSNEILDMKLNAELVVLSACDTGRGRITGDGVIGLSRSLITAGVPSIIVSLWKVPDEQTAFLMTEFYKNLKKSPDKAQALRQAMLTTRQNYPDPLNWAAFTLIGEAD